MKRKLYIPICIILICCGITGFVLFYFGIKDAFEPYREPSGVLTAVTPAPTSSPTPSPMPSPTLPPTPIPAEAARMLLRSPYVGAEMKNRYGMIGRLVIPAVGIDVAVCTDGPGESVEAVRQAVCDAEDSALLYFSPEEGAVIADHNTQAFATLINVEKGDKAYLIDHEKVTEFVCTSLTDGHNNNHAGLVDENFASIGTDHDIVMYTCMDVWTNIRIVEFAIVNEYVL